MTTEQAIVDVAGFAVKIDGIAYGLPCLVGLDTDPRRDTLWVYSQGGRLRELLSQSGLLVDLSAPCDEDELGGPCIEVRSEAARWRCYVPEALLFALADRLNVGFICLDVASAAMIPAIQILLDRIRRDGTTEPANKDGVPVWRLWWPWEDRYLVDFADDFRPDGWRRFDTDQDASYFGRWVNRAKRLVLGYCEGDWTLTECGDTERYNAEIKRLRPGTKKRLPAWASRKGRPRPTRLTGPRSLWSKTEATASEERTGPSRIDDPT